MHRPSRRAALRVVSSLPLVLVGCKRATLTFEYVGPREFSRAERAAIEERAEAAVRDVRLHLPQLPAILHITVKAGTKVIFETGESATAVPPDRVFWVVDPTREGGVIATVNAQLRATLHHELHHLVRDHAIRRASLMDHVVAEGLATAFERDAAGVRPPWGDYPANASEWVEELKKLPPDANVEHWLHAKHEDGRRWVGLRAGTFLADRASSALKRSPASLVATPTDDLVAAARIGP